MESNNTDSNSTILDMVIECAKDLVDKLCSKVTNDRIFIEVGAIQIQGDDDVEVADDVVWDSFWSRTN